MTHQKNVKWIVPPGLSSTVRLFEKHCKIAVQERMPVLIFGSTGIGKSLFLRIYEDIYKSEFGEKIKVTRVNCSHFAGSDPRIAQVELFGAVKGSANGIDTNREGMVSSAHGGLLVLDEIGELPLEVQAMLLTYIETGELRMLGGADVKTSTAFIVGATNRPEELRRDFYQRFFPFQLQPLHKRRGDVLYYFSCLYPDLINLLTPWEVLSLIAYHWPGNIREVERMGLLLKRNREKEFHRQSAENEHDIDNAIAVIVNDIMQSLEFSSALEELEEDTQEESEYKYLPTRKELIGKDQIDRILRPYFVSIDRANTRHPFSHFKEDVLVSTFTEGSNINILQLYEPFERAYIGYKIFCALFMQAETQNSNTIRMKQFTPEGPAFPPLELRILKKLTKGAGLAVIKALANLDDNDVDHRMKEVPFDQRRKEWFRDLYKQNPGNLFLKLMLNTEQVLKSRTEELDLSGYKRDDLLRSFYSQMLGKTGGVVKAAAKLMEMPYSSLRDDLAKLGIKRHKNVINTKYVI